LVLTARRSTACAAVLRRDLARGTPVNMGEAVGVIAPSRSASRAPSHHAHVPHAARGADQRAIIHRVELEGTIKIKNKNITRNRRRSRRDGAQYRGAIVDQDGTERAVHRIQYGARMKVDEGDKIKRGSASRVGSLHPAGADRSPARSVRGSGRRPVDDRVARRVDRYRKRVVIDWRTGSARVSRTYGRRS